MAQQDVQAGADRLPQAQVVDHDRVVGVEREHEHDQQERSPERGLVGLLQPADRERERCPDEHVEQHQPHDRRPRGTRQAALAGKPADVGRAQPGERPRKHDHVENDGRRTRAAATERPAESVGERPRLVVDRARDARRRYRRGRARRSRPAAPRRRAAPSRRRPAAAAAERAPGATSSRADRARAVGRGSSRVTIVAAPCVSRPSPCSSSCHPVQGALAGGPAGARRPRPGSSRRPDTAACCCAHGADSKREIASLTKLMTAHLALRYVPLGTVAVTGPDAVAVGESSVPLALGETQTVQVAAGGADRALGQRRRGRARARDHGPAGRAGGGHQGGARAAPAAARRSGRALRRCS